MFLKPCLQYRCCGNVNNKIGPVAFALALGPHKDNIDNKIYTDINFKPFSELRGPLNGFFR